jgi:hypothetical protein
MNEEEIFHEASMYIPMFEYDNGIAYQITVDSESISFTYEETGDLSICSLESCTLTTDLVNKIKDMLEAKLNEEIISNKLNWYYKYI